MAGDRPPPPHPGRRRPRWRRRRAAAAEEPNAADYQALRAENARLRQEIRTLQHASTGIYYAIIDRLHIENVPVTALWNDVTKVTGTEADFLALQRLPGATEHMVLQHWPIPPPVQPFKPYKLTEDELNSSNPPADDAASNTSSHAASETKQYLWPLDIIALKEIDPTYVGRLVPACVEDTNRWWFTADLLFQQERLSWTREARLRAIHGAKQHGRRLPHTGIKHLCSNKIKLNGQDMYFDGKPCLVLVPILSTEETRSWNGTPYSAIAVIGAWEQANLETVAHNLHMTHVSSQVATETELAMATELLRTCLKAIHYAVKSAWDDRRGWPGVDREWLTETKRDRTERVVSDDVAIPNGFDRDARVLKITFRGHNGEGSGHLAPDPILLAAKAAVNFARRRDTLLLKAAAEPQEDAFSEGDYMEAEAHWEYLQSLLRPPDDLHELARRLGQPVDG